MIANTCPPRFRLSSLILNTLIVIFAVNWTTTSASAQGTSGTLPDPISTSELVGYMERLNMSAQQQAAAESMHAEYKEQFRRLREGDIQAYLDRTREIQGTMPQRAQMESFVEDMERLNKRIAALDNQLFDRLQTVLSDDQLAEAPLVRMQRERKRHAGQQQMMWGMGGGNVDVSEVVRELDLNETQRQSVSPLLRRYETKLTELSRESYERTSRMWLDYFNALEAIGFTEESLQEDPAKAQEMMEKMQGILRDVTSGIREVGQEIRELNSNTVDAVRAQLAAKDSRSLRNRYYQRSYPQLAPLLMTNDVAPTYEDALQLEDLDEEQRETLTSQNVVMQKERDQIVDTAVEMFEKTFADFDPFNFDQAAMDEQQKQFRKLTERNSELMQQEMKTLHDTLTDEQHQKVVKIAAERNETADVPKPRGIFGNVIAEDNSESIRNEYSEPPGPDAFLPSKISERDVILYAKLFDLPEDQKAIMQELRKTYAERYDERIDGMVESVNDAQQSLWTFNEETGAVSTSTAAIDAIYDLREKTMKAIAEEDATYFDDVQLALGDDLDFNAWERMKRTRERQRFNRGDTSADFLGQTGSQEASVDLVRLVDRSGFDEKERKAAQSSLVEYETQITQLMQQKYNAAKSMQQAQERWQAYAVELQRDEGSAAVGAEYMANYREMIGGPTRQLQAVKQEIATHNAAALDALAEQLAPDAAATLRHNYNVAAFPSVYNDNLAVRPLIDKALKDLALTSQQREQLQELQYEYGLKYDELSDSLAKASRGSMSASLGFEADEWREYQKQQDKKLKLHFDRDELSSGAILKLKTILNEQQIEEIGGLPDIEARKNRNPFGG